MPRRPQPRSGETLVVKGRPLTFSYFPVQRTTRRYGLNDVVFAVDPWAIIEGAVNDQVAAAQRGESLAFVEQARAFFDAAGLRTPASPLLSYYAFLNVGKALIRCRGFDGSLDQAKHGLSDRQIAPAADLTRAELTIYDSPGTTNLFAEVINHLGLGRPTAQTVPVPQLASQIVVGHRLWREASGKAERFVVIEHIEFVKDSCAREVWLRLWFRRSDLSRYGITRDRLINQGGLTGRFGEVSVKQLTVDDDLVCLEQTAAVTYTGRPTDVVPEIVEWARPWLWRIITAAPEDGYRRYYLHLTPPGEDRRPQIASMWMLIYLFGSIVRYRPAAFAALTRGRYGAWVNDFIAAQPEQLLFMLATEMRRREVARPSIV
jgi:YaaC-like Protein